MFKSTLSLSALFAAFLACGTATAADLVNVQGKVTVNRGDGFIPAVEGMALKPGDQILVSEKSTASLIYADPGCVFEAAPTSVVTVAEIGPCVPGEATALGKSVLITPAAYSDHDYTVLYIVGGAVLLGTAAYLIFDSGDGNGNGNPVSQN